MSRPPSFDGSDPAAEAEWERLYRWCVYCGTDCWADEVKHRDECPSVTGKYPIEHPTEGGPGGGPAFCARCEKPLTGHYRLAQIGDRVYEAVCDDCALASLSKDSGETP